MRSRLKYTFGWLVLLAIAVWWMYSWTFYGFGHLLQPKWYQSPEQSMDFLILTSVGLALLVSRWSAIPLLSVALTAVICEAAYRVHIYDEAAMSTVVALWWFYPLLMLSALYLRLNPGRLTLGLADRPVLPPAS